MKKLLIAIILLLAVSLAASIYYNVEVNTKWKVAVANAKNYDIELSSLKDKSTAYQFTIEQLEYFKDSILMELDNTRKELKVKDKNLKALQYISSTLSRVDTIMLKDTIFREPSFKLDTIIGDKWYNVRLHLGYPSEVMINPEFRSEKHIVVSSRRETVNPPKRFFLFRLFQRKHTVVDVEVVERNIYVSNEVSKYIQIID